MNFTFEMKKIAIPGTNLDEVKGRMKDGGAMAYADPEVRHPRTRRPIEDIAVENELGAKKGDSPQSGSEDKIEFQPEIPPRPALKTMMEQSQEDFKNMLTQLFQQLIEGRQSNEEIERRVGEELKARLQKSIREWKDPPNAPMTVKRKGFNDPLIETGTLQRNIKWKRVR